MPSRAVLITVTKKQKINVGTYAMSEVTESLIRLSFTKKFFHSHSQPLTVRLVRNIIVI